MSNDKDDEFSRKMNQEAKDDLVSKNTTAICLEAARSTFLGVRRALNSIRTPAGVLGAGAGQGEPKQFEEWPYPQLLQSIENDPEKSQDSRAREINYTGDRANISRHIATMRAAGLVDGQKHSRVNTLSPKGQQYLKHLRVCGKV